MPRGSLLDVGKGMGFTEGYVRIDRSVYKAYQFPMNSQTKEQSDPFFALVWDGRKLNADWEELPGDENAVEIINRLGGLDSAHPGMLEPKDFDNLSVDPKDNGAGVGTEGNAIYLLPDKKLFSPAWGLMKESLEKAGWKPEILGRGVATDFVGTLAHFKSIEGESYIAKKGKKAGEKVTPTNLVVDRVHTFGYDKKAGTTAGAGTSTTAKPNGAVSPATSAPSAGDDDVVAEVGAVLSDLSDKFHNDVPKGKAVARDAFQKAMTAELYRKKLPPATQKVIMGAVKDDRLLGMIAETTQLFTTDGKTIQFPV